MDRRVRKTHKAIYDALITLMDEKDFNSITINEIANKADINRGTIYFHFQDKYDLLDKCIESYINQLLQDCSSDTPENMMYKSFMFLKENKNVFSILINNGGSTLFREQFFAIMLNHFGKNNNKTDNRTANDDIKNRFIVSAVVGVFEWWITSSMPYTPEEMVSSFKHIFGKILD